jgi:hypothetical protein
VIQRDLAGTRDGSASNESSVGNGVVRRTERAHSSQSSTSIEHAGNTVNLSGLEGLFEREGRQDRGHAFGQHSLTGTWGTDQARNLSPPRFDRDR